MKLPHVLKFLPPEATAREFAVKDIKEIMDGDVVCSTTVVRPRSDADGPESDRRILRNELDWKELLRDHVSHDLPVSNKKLGLSPHSKSRPHTRTLLLMFSPEPEAQDARQPMKQEMRSLYIDPHVTTDHTDRSAVTQPATTRLFGFFLNVLASMTSFLLRSQKKWPGQEADDTVSNREKGPDTRASASRSSQRRRLSRVPFTKAIFQTVVQRMAIHTWILRLISRANVPAFERTFTEMILYSCSGESMGSQKAIIYNCRTSNEWEEDMALSVTHFPAQNLTFALWFGPSETQQRNIISRLRKAGPDAAHPMLLPGILAELERGRVMEASDELINGIEEQLTRIGQETVSSWQLSSQTKAERNRQKTEAWLNATFSKNILVANVALLSSMRQHLDEFQYTVDPAPAPRQQAPGHYVPNYPVNRDWQPGRSQSPSSIADMFVSYENQIDSSSGFSRQNTLIAEPKTISEQQAKGKDDFQEAPMEAKDQDILAQAAMRMKDRITSIIAEYDDKIRHCTMEVDGMAMATQWSHGETNMEIATASGQDSSQMRSIALVTMVFLPGTFFASMFSMTFFNWNSESGGDHPTVSSSIWIYVLVTVVFTLITLLLFWYFILSRQRNNKSRQEAISAV